VNILKEETKIRRMWEKLLKTNLNCGWRSDDGCCLLRSKNDKNGLWRRGKCYLPCAYLDTGIWIKVSEDIHEKKKKRNLE